MYAALFDEAPVTRGSGMSLSTRDCVAQTLIVLAIFCIAVVSALPVQPLTPHKGIIRGTYIRHYEPAWYDATALRRNRVRLRREASDSIKKQPLILRLRAFDRQWTLQLVPDRNLFSENAVFEGTRGLISFDTSHTYTGTILEDENAIVQGIVTVDGLFDGTVVTGIEEYYFEPTSRYLPGDEDTSPYYHTISYRASDITTPSQPKRCGSNELYQGFLQESFHRLSMKDFKNRTTQLSFEHLNNDEIKLHNGLYSKALSKITGHLNEFENTNRNKKERLTRHLHKRATVDPRKTTCMLYLQADHQFFARYGTEEACIEVMTRHVQRVNSIYKNTDFNQDGYSDNISFMIKRIKVHSGDALRDPNYRFPGNYGVEKYLELFSEEDYDAFCLAYMFTYRDFEMGTLGLAWTGDLKNAGGVCEKNGHYRGSMKSLNTGIITLLNYGKHVPPAVSHVTLAHEIGHNFGSPHDPEQCTPGGEDGNFIMFARATSGDKRNNNRFSPCSLNAINPVLNTKARSHKGCFTEPQTSLCGNGVVEDGEECDCGWEEDCRDSCCFPQRRYPPAEELPCTLTPGSVCSPSQGPCCTTDCKLRFGDKCRDDNGCRDASFCDGHSPQCPSSINKPNKTICNKELVCFMGECTGSICLAYGLESCQCIPGPDDASTKACELCCRLPGENQPCVSSFDWNYAPYDIPDMFSKPGTPCNDYNGYCDVFQKCREVDPSGPLATLRKLLLSDESLATFRRWISEHWYAVTLIVLIVILLLIFSTRLLSRQPDQKLKSVTIIHSSTTETVRLPPEGTEGVTVHPPAVRAKLPLSKKVREKRLPRIPRDSNANKANDKPAKLKKKRVAPASADEPTRKRLAEGLSQSNGELKPKKSPTEANNKRKRKKKEVIDYSATQTENEGATSTKATPEVSTTDPKSKVRSWLLASQCRIEPPENAMLKSKSTPIGLASASQPTGRSAAKVKQVTLRRLSNPKNRSVGSIARNDARNDRLRLQVVYKHPFKFSVKLRKADKVGQTSGTAWPRNGPRTAVLVRTKKKSNIRLGRNKENRKNKTFNSTSIPEQTCSDLHTVPSDLEVLLSESEFLFSDT